ncbi:DUF262 domain-containing protein [Xylanimonas ulmi]|uniref:Uncharacterized protein DUF262 n=1 Tax=Xylanimonas ulmi TaxID=228973 RepID=A0A4Q7M6Y6_9MICO|nr:DUF262 domain-containing protein [Xylanibacterium ulmi]RZS62853.1 uncharacterized protein DUF262 [Xylanibacterium ulmi]
MVATVDYEALEAQLTKERKKVDVSSVSFSVRELVRMFADGELSIAPSYQRKYRWSAAVASTFVESVFLGLPIPPVFVATNDNFQWEVVDGLQRISTLIMFLAEDEAHLKAIRRETPLILEGLDKLSQLNGVAFGDMPVSIQRYFGRQPLQVISLTDKSDKEVRFDLFERLNSGAISLSPQEVRSAVFRGDFIDFLEGLVSDPNFASLLKLQEANKSDGTAAEQALKFFAYKNYRENFQGAVTDFLNSYVEKSSKSFAYADEGRLFADTMKHLASIIQGPFLRRNTHVTPLVQFEACAVAVGELIEAGVPLVTPDQDWLNDSELVDSSTGGTNTRSMLRRRIARAKVLLGGEE